MHSDLYYEAQKSEECLLLMSKKKSDDNGDLKAKYSFE